MNKKLRILLDLICGCGILLSPYAGAVEIPRTPQAAQLLPQNPRENVQTFPSTTELNVEQPALIAPTSNGSLYVRKIKIVGNTLFDTCTLKALVADGEHKILNLTQLNQLTARLSHFYQQHGYIFSRAYIPAQSIKDGLIQFNILEARYGTIHIKNNSRLACNRANLYLKPIHPNDIIEISKLNRSLFLINDLPGIVTRSILSPGERVGTSDLQLLIDPANFINGFIGIDNYGTAYTGRTRYSASLLFNNPSGQGDQIALDGVSSGRDLMYGHFGYNFPLYPGLNIGTNYYGTTYRLKNNVDPLQAEGNLSVADLWLSYDWIRRTHVNFNTILRYVYKNMHDNIKAINIYKMRYSNAAKLENTAEFRDPYGTTNIYLALTQGVLTLNNAPDGFGIDAPIAANSTGHFTKLNIHLSRLQQLTDNTSFYLAGDGQLASKNLDTSEQWILGGPFITRSYDVGAISGAQGYSATAELRHIINMSLPGIWRPMIFIDAGRVQIYKNQFTNDPNIFSLYSTGFGIDILWKGWSLSARYAHRLGSPPPLNIVNLIDKDQVWFQFGKSF